ncbi:MAG: hypothetical protein K0R66_1729 [Gammaproteobacteria bacterium]|jgi:NMD protein affecting ribosome stability and mRNA decay|nr:hypothetical protein [Gammaproteobacteria bacterium]
MQIVTAKQLGVCPCCLKDNGSFNLIKHPDFMPIKLCFNCGYMLQGKRTNFGVKQTRSKLEEKQCSTCGSKHQSSEPCVHLKGYGA